MPDAELDTTLSSDDGRIKRFEIVFDQNERPLFHGGERMTGSLKLVLAEPITIKAIKLQFKGRAVFNPDHNSTSNIKEKIFFDKDFILLERPPGNKEAGHFLWKSNFLYSLPFECPLPKGCSSSYESPNAFIRYFARAVFETDEATSVHYTAKKGFTIICPPDHGNELVSPSSHPVETQETCVFGGCCCAKGKLTAEISLPKNVYFPGEKVIGTFR
uniref:Arrestin_N domain-containing protein n=1 Tax=Rhabditophanes sp. KR3021 TaxID=114890 RepID=A0AC35U358_9BILA